MLFFKKKKKPKTEFICKQSPEGEGFHRLNLTTNYTKGIQTNIRKLGKNNPAFRKDIDAPKYIFDLSKSTIDMKLTTDGDTPCVFCYVDGLHVGTRYHHEEDELRLYTLIRDDEIEAAYIQFRPYFKWGSMKVYQLSFPRQEKVSGSYEHEVYLFIKLREN